MTVVNANPIELALQGAKERVNIQTVDGDGNAIDADTVQLRVVTLGNQLLYLDSYPGPYQLRGTVSPNAGVAQLVGTNTKFTEDLDVGTTLTFNGEAHVVQSISNNHLLTLATAPVASAANVTATRPTRIVKDPSGAGRYYIDWGDPNAPANVPDQTETHAAPCDLLFQWTVDIAGYEQDVAVQVLKIVTPATLSLLPGFRKLIDKSVKLVDQEDGCFLGYTDAQLIQYLEEGLTLINAYQPYPTWCALDMYPRCFLHVLHESALVAGVMSQNLFAIDTDIPNYCFIEGTDVTLVDGTRAPIEQLRVGAEVLDRQGQPQQVEAMWDEGVPAEIVKLKLWGGRELEVTGNHRIPVWAWSRTCACGCGADVRPGKMYKHGHHVRVNNPRSPSSENMTGTVVRGGGPTEQRIPAGYEPMRELEASEIRKGDFLMIPRKFAPVDTEVTLEQARFIGYYVAEGYRKSDSNNVALTFGLHEQDTWVRDVHTLLDKWGVKHRTVKDKNAAAVHVHTKNGTRRRKDVMTPCTELVDLIDLHVSGDCATSKALSANVLRWPVALKWELVRGMFRGDGHQNWLESRGGQTFSVWYSTASKDLADQLELILAQLGIPCRRVYDKPRTAVIRGVKTKSNGTYKLGVSGAYAKTLADFVWLDLSQAGSGESRRAGWSMPRHECMVDDDYVYVPVKSTEVIDNTRVVYNLTVSGDHSYLADGLGVFNSDQGNSFVIDHGTKLAAFLNQITTRLDKLIPQMKLHFVRTGSLHIQAGNNFRLAQLLNAAPNGALFRNIYFKGG